MRVSSEHILIKDKNSQEIILHNPVTRSKPNLKVANFESSLSRDVSGGIFGSQSMKSFAPIPLIKNIHEKSAEDQTTTLDSQ